jgi:hypothetical protein
MIKSNMIKSKEKNIMAASKKENQINLEEISQKIINTSSDIDISLDGHFGKKIDDLLAKAGFKIGKAYSVCKVSSFQELRELNGKRIEIINSNFMGAC